LGIGAIHHGDVAGRKAFQSQILNGVDDYLPFFQIVVGFIEDDGVAALPLGEQFFVDALRIAFDNGRCRVQNDLGRAVVLLQQNHGRVWVRILEALDVAEVGAAPFVDRLVGVADGEDVAVRPRQPLQQRVLGGVGVLKFVHQHVLVALLVFLQHVGPFVEEQNGVHEQIVEVHGVVGLQRYLIAFVDAAGYFGDVVGGAVNVGGDEFVFGRADAVEDFGRRELFVVEVEFFEDLFDDLKLVGGVEDDEVAVVVGEVVGFAAQDASADGMEGAHCQAAWRRFEHVGDAVGHFAGRFVGEGDGQDLPGGEAHFAHQVDDALGEDAGFAAAGAGEDEDGAGDGCLLLGVQTLDEGRRGSGLGVSHANLFLRMIAFACSRGGAAARPL
jgi:hypothetical protein